MNRQLHARLTGEARILAKYFPAFRWFHREGHVYVEGPVTTNGGKAYGLRVEVPPDYPSTMPTMLVTRPRPLASHNGRHLGAGGASSSMHVLGASDDGVVICHGHAGAWNPARTLYTVLVKGRLWLEAYDRHLATGLHIDEFLRHQE